MKSLDVLQEEGGSLPGIGSEVSLMHPLYELPANGTIAAYTCSEGFDRVDGAQVDVNGVLIDCRLCDVEVR